MHGEVLPAELAEASPLQLPELFGGQFKLYLAFTLLEGELKGLSRGEIGPGGGAAHQLTNGVGALKLPLPADRQPGLGVKELNLPDGAYVLEPEPDGFRPTAAFAVPSASSPLAERDQTLALTTHTA